MHCRFLFNYLKLKPWLPRVNESTIFLQKLVKLRITSMNVYLKIRLKMIFIRSCPQ